MRLLPHLLPQVLFSGQGRYVPVRVVQRGPRLELFTGQDYLQSAYTPNKPPAGTVFDWYLAAPFFGGNFAGRLKNLLLLGLGGGAAVKLYNQTYAVGRIIGVEIDPLIIDLARKYFNLNDANLTIVNDDVAHYVPLATEKFDVILLDTFQENIFADSCASLSFLERTKECLLPNGVLLVNRVAIDPTNKELEEKLIKIFKSVFALNVHRNIFYLATDSPTAPASPKEAVSLIVNAARHHPSLKFLKSLRPSALSLISGISPRQCD